VNALPGETGQNLTHPGRVAGAVLRAARLSADHLTEARLAAAAGVSEEIIRHWEDGSLPLASVAAPQTERLATALRAAEADPRLVAELPVAAWCDLVILAIADNEDSGLLLADPMATEAAFRELLTWSISDQPPERYQPYANQTRLLPDADIAVVRGITQVLASDQ
jgi:hypothetical protein